MRERGRCWEENYDEVREINDKSHSERKKKGGGVKERKGGGWVVRRTVRGQTYILAITGQAMRDI